MLAMWLCAKGLGPDWLLGSPRWGRSGITDWLEAWKEHAHPSLERTGDRGKGVPSLVLEFHQSAGPSVVKDRMGHRPRKAKGLSQQPPPLIADPRQLALAGQLETSGPENPEL